MPAVAIPGLPVELTYALLAGEAMTVGTPFSTRYVSVSFAKDSAVFILSCSILVRSSDHADFAPSLTLPFRGGEIGGGAD
ncbi:MAG: hypothetical protein A2Y81_09455 [Nitrospirae bacterium RBG_13_43_8]|nr:MAG: hypothetical protein A2Y81_09455 [Nitrospirae bacterium RBG_13_43_8]